MGIYIRILDRKLAISYSFHKVYGPIGLGGVAYLNLEHGHTHSANQ